MNSWFCMFRTGVYCDSVNNLLTSVVSWLRLSGSSRLIVFIFGLTITVLNLVIALCMIICVESQYWVIIMSSLMISLCRSGIPDGIILQVATVVSVRCFCSDSINL